MLQSVCGLLLLLPPPPLYSLLYFTPALSLVAEDDILVRPELEALAKQVSSIGFNSTTHWIAHPKGGLRAVALLQRK